MASSFMLQSKVFTRLLWALSVPGSQVEKVLELLWGIQQGSDAPHLLLCSPHLALGLTSVNQFQLCSGAHEKELPSAQ